MNSEAGFNSPVFVTTRWTVVLNARGDSPEARASLSELCAAYWTPAFRFVQRRGYGADTARDLTQGFFARLLAGGGLNTVDPLKGRFRSFLLGAIKHYLADQFDRARAAKRGAGQAPISLSSEVSDSNPGPLAAQIADPDAEVPDSFFDHQWALRILERALEALAAEFATSGKAEQFEALKSWLPGENSLLTQAEAGARLGLSEGAVKVAIHRLRKRFRALVQAEVAQTLTTPDQLKDEIRYLIEVLAQSQNVAQAS